LGCDSTDYDERAGKAAHRQGIKKTILWKHHSGYSRKEEVKKKSFFSSDVTEFLYLLSKHKVQFLIVGGEAVIYYGYARLTGDIDIFYDRSAENIEKIFDMLNEFWNGEIPGIYSTKELKQKGMVFQFGVPPNRIDLINDIDGVSFKKAWERKVINETIYRKKDFEIYYIGIDDLIKNKKAVNRNKDKDDMRFLSEVKKRALS
jgi:hypothetical protein